MKPQARPDFPTDDLFRHRLDNLIDRRHGLVKISELIDWEGFDAQCGEAFCEMGHPAIATRLVTGLHYLKPTYSLSDEQVVRRWAETRTGSTFVGRRILNTHCR